MIVVINDNLIRLADWVHLLKPMTAKAFTHPNDFLSELSANDINPTDIRLVLVDKFFYGKDLLHSEEMNALKAKLPKLIPFVVTSSAHAKGDKIKNYSAVISGKALEFKELRDTLAALGVVLNVA